MPRKRTKRVYKQSELHLVPKWALVLVHWHDIEHSSGWDHEVLEDKDNVFVFVQPCIWRGMDSMRAFVTDSRPHKDYQACGSDLNFPIGVILKVEVLRRQAPEPYYISARGWTSKAGVGLANGDELGPQVMPKE